MSGFYAIQDKPADWGNLPYGYVSVWTAPQVEILQGASPLDLEQQYVRFRDRPAVLVLAISPATLTVGEAQYPDGSGRDYAYLMTVVYQERIPKGGDE